MQKILPAVLIASTKSKIRQAKIIHKILNWKKKRFFHFIKLSYISRNVESESEDITSCCK